MSLRVCRPHPGTPRSRFTALLAALCMALSGASATARAGERIFLSTTSGGLPSYTHEPSAPDSALYLTLSDPPPRPRQRLSAPALRPRPTSPGAYARLLTPTVRELVAAASRAYGVPHALLLAVMHAESNFDPAARSPVGAIGLMQIMPPTGARYGVRQGLADPVNNIDVGARYLKDLLELFKGDTELAVAAYNAGEGAVIKYGRRIPPYAETRAYVPKVMALYERYSIDGSLLKLTSLP
jgi:soluble lytic murein transglycosylase-like protein